MAIVPMKKDEAKPYHSLEELDFYKTHLKTPIDSDAYFLTPQNCKGCHGFDTLGIALVDAFGRDVNLYDDWETSMMGLSAVDPLWRAKVSHEIQVNPSHANELQTLCTSCHAPMGHFTAIYKGLQHYTLADLYTDTLGLAGVACMGCHSMDSVNQGNVFSGNLTYDTSNVAYGPFENPMMGPMQLYVGLTPKFSTHLNRGNFCSPCHTLISNTVDLSGVPTGGTFVEQATYHEWLNSSYPSQEITCQTCHMPQIEDLVKIATGNTALPGRSPYNLHQFAGANSFMVQLMKDNKGSLGISASAANFDSTLTVINTMLKSNTLVINAYTDTVINDSAYIDVLLTNKAGHKFPSGYPARRAVLQLVAVKANGDTLFASGLFDNNFEVKHIDPVAEEHYQVIKDSTEVQVYEMVMADVNGNKTTVLERAATQIKDNRIPPLGFSNTHSAYDTCKIVGGALIDSDFNKNGPLQGTGKDWVHYHIPLHNYHGQLTVYVSVFYQSVPPSWLDEMSTFSSPEIDSFLVMYNNADRSPVLIGGDTISGLIISTGIPHADKGGIRVFPNPSINGKIVIKTENLLIKSIKLYDTGGSEIKISIGKQNFNTFGIQLPEKEGIYFLKIMTDSGDFVKKVVRLKNQ